MPKLNYHQNKGKPAPMEWVEGEKSCQKVLEAVRAIEVHMSCLCIVMGILQSLSIQFIGKARSSQMRHQRTSFKGRVSEAAIMGKQLELYITQIIQGLQEEPEEQWDFLAS